MWDRGVVPVQHADDLQAKFGRLRNDDIGLLEVGMADAEMAEGGALGDE